MSKDKDITVYWSPGLSIVDNSIRDNSFLYPKPESLFADKAKDKSKLSLPKDSFFSCPAVSKKIKNTFVFSNAMDSRYYFDFTDKNNQIMTASPNSLEMSVYRAPVLYSGPCLSISLSYLFFAEESVDAFFTPPYFHEPKYMKYGSVIPGEFDIGQWFRPFNFDLQMWNNKGDIIIEKNEPLFYVDFQTNKKIKLKRFIMTKQLQSYAESCGNSTNTFGLGQSLKSRYDRFRQVGLREKVLTEIKKNLIED